ncbi:GNAT family N-acetyltransferase [soil metagenome]
MNDFALLRRLEHSLRTVGAQTRDVVEAGGFAVFIDRASSAYLLSFAVPSNLEPEDGSPDISAMREVFESRGRRPRLEYFHELHPGLAWALEEAGFAQDMNAPVMTLVPEDLASSPTSVEENYVRFTAEDEDRLEPFLRGQHLAYGGDGEDALVWLPNLLSGLKAGRHWVAGLEHEGRFVSGAMIQGGGVGELAGVWTLPEEQKRGHAFAVCQRLLHSYFADGHDLCWLSAAEGALSVYEELGFKWVGTQLNYGLPEGG